MPAFDWWPSQLAYVVAFKWSHFILSNFSYYLAKLVRKTVYFQIVNKPFEYPYKSNVFLRKKIRVQFYNWNPTPSRHTFPNQHFQNHKVVYFACDSAQKKRKRKTLDKVLCMLVILWSLDQASKSCYWILEWFLFANFFSQLNFIWTLKLNPLPLKKPWALYDLTQCLIYEKC